jgi:hypothetical protein
VLTQPPELTFILLARPEELASKLLLNPADLAQCKMVGDVNLFLPDGPAEDVECEIMIAGEIPCQCIYLTTAERDYRGKGVAKEALTLL